MIIFNFEGLQHPLIKIFKNNNPSYYYKKGYLLSNSGKQFIRPFWNLKAKNLCISMYHKYSPGFENCCGCFWCTDNNLV